MSQSRNQGLTEEEQSLVQSMARRVYRTYFGNQHNSAISLDDLYHCGMVGLLQARRAYNASTGVPFLGFASKRILGEMMDFVRRRAPLVLVPQLQWDRVRALKAAREALRQASVEPSALRLAEHLGWSADDVAAVERMIPRVESTDQSDADDNRTAPAFRLSGGEEPDAASHQQQLTTLLEQCLEALKDEKLRTVLIARQLHDAKLRELAKLLDCTTQWVSQLERQAKKQLRKCLEEKGLAREDVV